VIAQPGGGALAPPDEHHRRARAEWGRGNLKGALIEFQSALALAPTRASALADLAVLLLDELNNVQSAERFSRRAVAADPRHAPGYIVLGNALKARGDDAAAADNYRRALALDPRLADPMVNLGVLALESGDTQGALDWFTRALEAEPGHLNGRWNRGNLLLMLGRYAEGWEDYEFRFRIGGRNASRVREDRRGTVWDGSPFPGKTLAVWCEQGLGDTIQFVRYLPLVKARGGTVVFECQEELVTLLRNYPGADAVIASSLGSAPRNDMSLRAPLAKQSPTAEYDLNIPLLSLPGIFGTTEDTIPASVPYITAEPGLVDGCREQFAGDGLNVGLIWQGNPSHPNDANRSCSPSDLEPLAAVGGVRLYSLQKFTPGMPAGAGVLDGRICDLAPRLGDFAQTAAHLAHIDLLITVDTAAAHLAGAMGKPVWLLVPRIPDWRWQLEREDTPWYPSLRLFRQTTRGDWASVIQNVARSLRAVSQAKQSGREIASAPAVRQASLRSAPRNDSTGSARNDSGANASALYEQGAACFAAGDHDGALRLFREAIAADPAGAPAHNALGVVLTIGGDLAGAAAELTCATALDPRNAEARYNLGNVQKQQGDLAAAAASYREALAEAPDLLPAHVNLGVVLSEMGEHTAALEEYRAALAMNPTSPEMLKQVGELCVRTGDGAGAMEAFERALAADPGDAPLIRRVAGMKIAAGNTGDAVALLRRSVEARPDDADAWGELGTALVRQGDQDGALVALEHALRIKPDFPGVLNNMGMVMKEKGQTDLAEKCFTLAIRSDPSYAVAYNNLGTVLLDRSCFAEAESQFREAVRLQADYLLAWNNLGNALAGQGKFHEAKQIYRLVIDQDPAIPEVHFNLASALAYENRFSESLRGYEEAIRIRPDYYEARLNRALILLQRGDLEEGWKEYEYRFNVRDPLRLHVPPGLDVPRWEGGDPRGMKILVRAEQGYGDSFQFGRYLTLLAAKGAHVIFECPKEISGLFRGFPGVDALAEFGGAPPVCDAYVQLLSLPRLLGTRGTDEIPWNGPYIHADTAIVDRLAPQMGRDACNVGIVWGGNPLHKNDHNRSCPLAEFLPLFDVPGVRLFSLQKGKPAQALSSLPAGCSAVDLGSQLTDFSVTAAALEHLDLLIAVDTSVAHLAGAMGKPVWLLLPFRSDWRWLADREDSPWYPSMRLFRQKSHGDWGGVMQEVALSLRALSAKQSGGRLLRFARNDRGEATNE